MRPLRPCLDCGRTGPWDTRNGIRCPACHREWARVKRATHRYMTPPLGRCGECGSGEDLTWDHRVPVSRGGTSARANLAVLCRRCNGRKGRLRDRLR